MVQALIFDLDGTLLDSDRLHVAVFADMLAPHGFAVDEAFYRDNVLGRRNTEVFAELLPGEDAQALDVLKEATFRARLAETTVPPTPGLIALLDRADAAGMPCGVATNACNPNVVAMLGALGITDRFAAIVSADDCQNGKPHPEPFATAAQKLGVDPQHCLAFEDSPPGIASARAAGCTVVGLTTNQSPDALRAAGAHHVIEDFNDPALAPLLDAPIGAHA